MTVNWNWFCGPLNRMNTQSSCVSPSSFLALHVATSFLWVLYFTSTTRGLACKRAKRTEFHRRAGRAAKLFDARSQWCCKRWFRSERGNEFSWYVYVLQKEKNAEWPDWPGDYLVGLIQTRNMANWAANVTARHFLWCFARRIGSRTTFISDLEKYVISG